MNKSKQCQRRGQSIRLLWGNRNDRMDKTLVFQCASEEDARRAKDIADGIQWKDFAGTKGVSQRRAYVAGVRAAIEEAGIAETRPASMRGLSRYPKQQGVR